MGLSNPSSQRASKTSLKSGKSIKSESDNDLGSVAKRLSNKNITS